MPNYTVWDRVFSTLSWFIVPLLVTAAIGVWVYPPTGLGPVAGLLGVLGSQLVYSILYGGLGITLIAAKVNRNKVVRKHVLMAIYLSGILTTLLTLLIAGWTPKVIDNILIIILSAICWMYWKFKTEYLTDKEFDAMSFELDEE